eukprot:TRINITY_DN14606_c0_g1_i3.p1 TRINITY_DN14606_c0_g1~~TRINITY_DN14606_c0_g1_i3.p1  ORF type:complete len:346 (-),score=88.94 TRINITY_DN14606_c0_g1_i3:126-1118(-)
MLRSLVGSEMCIRDRYQRRVRDETRHHMHLALFLLVFTQVASLPTLPMAARYIPADIKLSHGRSDVHGWLWLPKDLKHHDPTEPVRSLSGYWYHHTPEFGLHSPHDFEIMIEGTVHLDHPLMGMPLPPTTPVLSTEYAFTPPAFSLDELITRNRTRFYGEFTNGTFDRPPRVLMSNGTLEVHKLTTVHYLYDSHNTTLPEQAYLSYPRSPSAVSGSLHLYWLHLLWSGRGTGEAGSPAADYDQLVHVVVDLDSCTWLHGDTPEDVNAVGATFTTSLTNTLGERLHAGEHSVMLHTLRSVGHQNKSSCKINVVEELHCVVMPDSLTKCPST